jgi:proton-dependent oligopeptide transporter, POT family
MLFFTEMWERFSFYGMRALLILYMTHVLLFPDRDANLQYGAYNALVYTMPLLGGWLADRMLGFRKSIVLGGILMAIGHLVLAIPSESTFFLGLGFLISGNGFFKPNISSLLGRYYSEDDPRKNAGYSIFYMGVNIGAFLGSAICGYLGQKVSWHLGFGIAGVFMVLGLIVFLMFQHILDDQGFPPAPAELDKKLGGVIKTEYALYIGAFMLVPIALLLVKFHSIMSVIMYPIGIGALGYVIWESFKLDKVVRQKLWAATIMIIFSIIFWGFYEQSGGSLNLMAERNVDMSIGSSVLPSAMVNNSLNPFYIIFLTPLFALMWDFLIRKKIEPNTPTKFGLSFLFLGAGYYVFVLGGSIGSSTGMMPMIYFLLGYLLITTGELFISPIGLSMITKLSPLTMVGFMMGLWFLASAFGHHLGGEIGAHMSIPKNMDGSMMSAVQSLPIYMGGCNQIALVSLIGGVIILLVSPFIKKWMHGIH